MKNGAIRRDSKSEKFSVGRMSLKTRNDENNHCNGQTKINDKRVNDSNIVDEDIETDSYCKGCWHKFTHFLKFEGFNRTTLKLCLVSIAYIVIYIPWFVVKVSILFEPTEKDKLFQKYNYLPVAYLPFAGCAVNPVIYAFVDPKFRSQCRALFHKAH